MIEGTTKSGFNFKITDETINNWEFVECIDEMVENPSRVVKFIKLALGDEQYAALKKHNTVNGIVETEKMNADITEILDAEEIKNS